MKSPWRRTAPGGLIGLSLLLLAGLVASLVLTVGLLAERDAARAAPVALHYLTDRGPETLMRAGPGDEAAYARLLQESQGEGAAAALWRRLRRHAALRDAEILSEAGDLPGARQRLEALHRRDPGDLTAAWRRLQLLAAQRDQAALIEASGALLQAAPGFGPALLLRARAREAQGERLEAVTDLAAALQRPMGRSDFEAAAVALLQLLVDVGHPGDARRLAERLGLDLPASPAVASALGHAAHLLGDHAAAAAYFEAAREGTAEAAEVPALLLAQARSLDALGRSSAALELLLAVRFTGQAETERRRLLSRLAGRLDLAALAIASAEEALAQDEDPALRLELAQRLLDGGEAERALLVLQGSGGWPCAEQPAARLAACRRLAAEALRRSDRLEEAAMLLRTAFGAGEDARLLSELGVTLLALGSPLEAGHLLVGLSAAEADPAIAAGHRGAAAEAYLDAGRPQAGLVLLDDIPADLRPARAEAVELAAAESAADWPRLLRLLEARPAAGDGLPADDGEARVYCQALAALDRPGLAGCVEALARRHPGEAALQYYAADLARRGRQPEAALRWLERAIALRLQGRWLLESGFLLLELERPEAAERRFRAAESAGVGAEATLALAYALMHRDRPGPAAHLLRRALEAPGLAGEDRWLALSSLSLLLEKAGNSGAEAAALEEALSLRDDPALRLRLARAALRRDGPAAAEAALEALPSDRLEGDQQAQLLDLQADLLRARGERHGAVALRRLAAGLAPTAVRQELLASALLARRAEGDEEEARESLLRALALGGGESPRLLARLAYLDRAAGELPRAERLLREAMLLAPATFEYREDLALLLAETGRREEALAHLRVALDAAADHPWAGEPERRAREARLRGLHAGLSRQWRLRLEETLCLGRHTACSRPALLARESQLGQGLAEASFRPLLGTLKGRLELTARLNWDRAAGRLAPRGRFAQVALGLRAQPLADRDLWVGAERLQALGAGGRDDWRLHLAYRVSRGMEWHAGSRELQPFASFYGELGRFLGGAGESYLAGDAAVGLRGQTSERFAYLPFVYLAGGNERAGELRLARMEAGLGLMGSWRFGQHRYDRHLGEADLSLRLGQERDDRGGRATRGLLSLGLRY